MQSLGNKMQDNLHKMYRRGKGVPKSQDPDLENIHSVVTLDHYLNYADYYADWLKSQGHKSGMAEAEAIEYIQEYIDYLVRENYRPTTIHTYTAGVCKALGVHMRDYDYPRRTTPPTKGRDLERIAEMEADPKFAEIIPLVKAIGIRRAEYLDLRGRDLVRRDGHCYVYVVQGKGGKAQYQLIDDCDVPVVEARFAGLGPDDPVFTPRELCGLNLHHYRRVHAQEMYDRYMSRMKADPNYRQELIEEIKCAFDRGGRNWRSNYDMRRLDKPYRPQRNVRADMIAKGLPTEYDRVALMAVSVLHLSHWRTSVAVQHYMR